jgi:hypothetical protein
MAALVYRHMLAPTVRAGAVRMQALLAGGDGEPIEQLGSTVSTYEACGA